LREKIVLEQLLFEQICWIKLVGTNWLKQILLEQIFFEQQLI
jgi:hypothetical protein